jgi:hypothetical protein
MKGAAILNAEEKIALVYPELPETSSFHTRIHELKENEMLQFLNEVVPKGVLLKFLMTRHKYDDAFYYTYECYNEETGTHLMTANKKSGNKTSNLEIAMAATTNVRIGKVRSNFTGSEYMVYDNGLNPEKLSAMRGGTARKELAFIQFQSNIFGNCPRQFTVTLPRVTIDGAILWQPLTKTASMKEQIKRDSTNQDMMVLKSKVPIWSKKLHSFALDFKGRAKIASVKNFQIIELNCPQDIIMQYGKMDKDLGTLDVQYPMSPLQAFAIALAGLDGKWICD